MAAVNKNKLLDNATKYIQKGQVDRAIKELQKVIEADPADVRTRLKLGDLFAKKNQNAEAAEQYNLVAESYSKDGFYLKAVAVYKQILKLDSTLIDVHLKLGDLYHQLGLLSDAMSQYQIVAQHYDSKGMAKESLATLRKMVELDPENIQSRKKLAEIIAREGQTAEAIAEFQKIAEDLKSKARLDDLAGVLERIVHLDSTNLETVRELAALYLDRGDPKRALAKLQICFRANPHDLGTLEMLSKAFVSLGQPEKAKSVYREIAKIHEAAGNAPAKMDAFRSILQLDPNDGEARAVVEGRAAPEPSVAAYEEISVDASMPAAPEASVEPARPPMSAPAAPIAAALADDPQTISKLLTEADVYLKYGLLEKALDHLRNIVRRNPGNVDAHLKLKDVYLQHKDIDGAVAEILAVVGICEQAGDEARAAEAMQEGLRFAPGHASLEGRGVSAPAAEGGLWNSGEPEVEEPLGGDAGEVEISIDGGEDASDIVIDPAPGASDFSGSEIQIPDEEAEIQVDSGQLDDSTSIEVDAPLEANPIAIDASVDISVVDDIAIDAGEIGDYDAELPPVREQVQPRAAVVSLEARRNEISARSESPRGGAPESIQMPVPAAISADQLLDELASAFDGTGGEMRAAEKEEIEFSAPEALSFDEPRMAEAEIEAEEVEIDADPGISPDLEPLNEGHPPTIEERFGATDENEIPQPSPQPEFPLDADLSSSSGITDFSVDLSGDEISLSSDEPLADDAALALETDDAFAVDEPSARPIIAPPAAPLPPTQASSAAALAAATALNADPIPAEIADDVDEADFFVKQEIYDEAISVYKRLLKKFPGNGGLTERMARAQALLNGEAPASAPVTQGPKAAVPEARVEPKIEAKPEPKVEPRVEAKKPPVLTPQLALEPDSKPAQSEASRPVVVERLPPPPSRPEPVEETGGFDLAAELMAELDEIAEEEEDAQPSFDETEQVSVADVLREFRKGVDKQVGMEDKQARYDLGIAYREMGLLEEAIGEFLIASGDAARKADCYNMMGLCQRDKGDVESAIKSFSESIKSPGVNNKQKAAFFYELATCLDQKGEPSKALQAFKQVQALDPGFRDVVDKIKKLGGDEGPSMKKIGYV